MICDHIDRKEKYLSGSIALWKCRACGLVFADKNTGHPDPEVRYNDYYYNNEIVGRFNSPVESIIRVFRFFRAFKMHTLNPDARTILDIGSGRGFMLYYLKKYYRYSRTAGTQISKNAFEFSRDRLGLEVYKKDLLDLPFENNSFDTITLWHVLEHVAEPERYIARICGLLTKNGKLVIEVPNFDSWTRRLTGQYWLSLDPEYHIHFFTPASLSRLLKKYNFNVKIVHTFSLEYSTFISAQSLASRLTRTDHVIFRSLQGAAAGRRMPAHILLIAALMPVCLVINLFLYYSKKGEVLLIVADKA